MTINQKTYIIAEAGVNHNGSLEVGLKLIDAAAQAGADAVKFQTFRADKLLTRYALKASYQQQSTDPNETQFDMIQKLELSDEDHVALIARARANNIEFISTPFDMESLDLLTDQFNLKTIKVSSGDITDAPFLLQIAQKAPQIMLSTGMTTLAEIEAALGVLAYGLIESSTSIPQCASFERAYASDAGQQALRKHVSLLHCTSEYPAPVAEVNLRAMDTLAAAFGLRTGYSDHTLGIHIPIAAVARGAKILEKHFTLDRNLPGPDHRASLTPQELQSMVTAIRDIEQSLGDGIKRPTASEWENRSKARKSLVVEHETAVGEPLKLACKRSGPGVSPFEYWNWSGKQARREYAADEAL